MLALWTQRFHADHKTGTEFISDQETASLAAHVNRLRSLGELPTSIVDARDFHWPPYGNPFIHSSFIPHFY
jgi:hypothetical protein